MQFTRILGAVIPQVFDSMRYGNGMSLSANADADPADPPLARMLPRVIGSPTVDRGRVRYINGRLVSNDTLSFCYTQAGGKTESSVVSCTQVKRAR